MDQRGSVLITALWILALLAFLAAAMGMRMRLEAKMMGLQIAGIRHREILESGVERARFLIEQDPERSEDSVSDLWHGSHSLAHWVSEGEGYEVDIRDEESKVNVNLAPPQLLRILFEVLDRRGTVLETEPEDLAAAMVRWRGETPPFGGPSAYHSKRQPFESLMELLLIEHITPADAAAVSPYLTVFSKRGEQGLKVNINTASEEVLETLVESLAGDDFAKKELYAAMIRFRKAEGAGARRFFEIEDLATTSFLRRIQVSSTVPMISLVNQFLAYATVDSSHFEVTVRAPTGARFRPFRIEAVIGPTGGRPSPASVMQATVLGRAVFRTDNLDILSWQERT
jgi:hypothetical protein